MELYAIYFALLVLFNVALAWRQHRGRRATDDEESLALPHGEDEKTAARNFKLSYFTVYGTITAADWLQGPYMYTLYRDEKNMPESTVAALFTTGFICAAITATFVGSLADKYGRRAGCLIFCLAYSISCLSVLSEDLTVLFLGRALGGMSTTLLYSVFEPWMIAEYHSQDISNSLPLGDMFSMSVTLSCIVAIISGILGEIVVAAAGTKKAPFLLAVVLLTLAAAGMLMFWGENYGEIPDSSRDRAFAEVQTRLLSKRILALTFVTTVFEGSTYLFVYFWSPALKYTRSNPQQQDTLPFGLIFSCFMCAMMVGSMIYPATQHRSGRDTPWVLLVILSMAADALLIPVVANAETIMFWSFALFELCVGMYYPTMSRLKSELVDDAVRAKVYGLMRLPLNAFVVVSLGATKEGDGHRALMFTIMGALLLSAFIVVQRFLV